ncbi:hypothetical protein KAR91_20785 [Candidatus Pacearchaeota archaeon]|nr:hypothetical protein [Candidatus Pacearchaeota archaeon]
MKKLILFILIFVLSLVAFGRQQIQSAATDTTREVLLLSATTGSPITGVTITDLDTWFTRVETDNDVTVSAKVDMSALADLVAAHADDSAFEIGHGYYRIDMPDGVFAAGATTATYIIEDAASSSIIPVFVEFQLTGDDPYSVGVNITYINGNATNGNNATLKLKQLHISNSDGDALYAASTGSNGNGIYAVANGIGAGIKGFSPDGAGMYLVSTNEAAFETSAGTYGMLLTSDLSAIYLDNNTDYCMQDAANGTGFFSTGAITADAIAANAMGDSEWNVTAASANVVQVNGNTTVADNLAIFALNMLDLVNNWVYGDIKALDGSAVKQTDGKIHTIKSGI